MSKMGDLDLATRELAEERNFQRGGPPRYGHGERHDGDLIAEYVYKHADGSPFHRVRRVRCAGVDRDQFPQCHWLDGDWRRGKPAGPPLPYLLPQLLAAPLDLVVFVCEGEKDADNVVALGEIATTSPGGAGKWDPALNHWFVGRRVCVLPDNDKPGGWHAKKVARNLEGVAAETKILELPGLGEGEDATDWIERGGTRHQLRDLYEAAPAYRRLLPSPGAPVEVAQIFVDEHYTDHGSLTLRAWRGGFWRWRGPAWAELDPNEVKAQLYAFTRRAVYSNKKGDVEPWSPTENSIRNLIGGLGAICHTSREIEMPTWLDGSA